MIRQQPLIEYTLLDSSESSGVLRFNTRHGVTVDSAMAGATNLRGKIEPLTGARFTRQSVIYPSVEPLSLVPLVDSLAQRVAVFIFNCGLDRYAIVEVCGIRDEMLLVDSCGGLLLDQQQPAVEIFIAYMISGVWVNRFGHPLVALEAAFLQIRP